MNQSELQSRPSKFRMLPKLLLAGMVFIGGINMAGAEEDSAIDGKIKEWFALAKKERVAVVGIGDSNQRFGGHGYTRYMPLALSEVFGCYGSSLLFYRQHKADDKPAPTPAPEELASITFSYWYIPPGSRGTVGWQNGQLIIPADHPLDVKGNLRFHFTYGSFPGDAGTFRPTVRRDQAPWSVVASAPDLVDPVSDKYGLAHFSLDMTADPGRDYPLQFMPSPITTPIEGAFLASSAMCENLDKESGIAYHTLYASGGQSLVDMLNTFRNQGPERLGEFFSRVRETLNGKKTCIVMIHSGLNDRNEKLPSAGPQAGQSSSSATGYTDNLQGIMETLNAAWVKAGGDADTLFFAFMPSHALGNPDDAKLVSYRQAARELAASLPNASLIDLEKLVPYEKMAENKYYDKGRPSDSHLDRKGYEAISQALAKQLAN